MRPGWRLALVALLPGCGVADLPGDRNTSPAQSYAPPAGRLLMFGPELSVGAERLLLLSTGDRWALRRGARWRDAVELTVLEVEQDGALVVAGETLLPAVVGVGQEQDGASVVARGEYEVWYGTFPGTATVEVAEGTFEGTQVFAQGHGPIRLSLDPLVVGLPVADWELVGYEEAPEAAEALGAGDSDGG